MLNKSTLNMNLDSVDAMMITDRNGKILYSVRYNPRFCNEKNAKYRDILDKNILEAYPSLTQKESSIFQCIKNATPVYNKGQKFYDAYKNPYFTENLAIPIIRSGKLVGVVELSKDITSIQDEENEPSPGRLGHIEYSKREQEGPRFTFDDIITENTTMLENIEIGKMVADSPSSVMVYGETGTGKELFVQSIHNSSQKLNAPFIAQNCAAIPETLFESTLFGTSQGAYTGATNQAGLFEQADGGTLFLDEINSMPLHLQAKLLRVIQDGCVRRLGGSRDKRVHVRIMSAMNEPPQDALANKHIREDLFYRLGIVTIKLPPLRERKEDIPLLVKYFTEHYNKIFDKHVVGISEEVREIFLQYSWPGNVRELQHVIESVMNLIAGGRIEVGLLPIYFRDLISQFGQNGEKSAIKPLSKRMDTFEKEAIQKALSTSGGNIAETARILQMPRQTLQYKIKKYQIAALN